MTHEPPHHLLDLVTNQYAMYWTVNNSWADFTLTEVEKDCCRTVKEKVICEIEMGQNKQIKYFFWMTHPALILIVEYSLKQRIRTTTDFSSSIKLKYKLSKVLLGQKWYNLMSLQNLSSFSSVPPHWVVFRLATPLLFLHVLSFPYPSRIELAPWEPWVKNCG